ncbi:hypothetical protein DdX_04249 [Ditylenchus destructor]|uniref:Uncharacterized protein n=1 Tax=Ditylenchus destructor TaxID=166010 RepID=A0AAD4N9I4_9BILA|nr:hypothetical protein DdX_04249 [Ditylenchus destructor]
MSRQPGTSRKRIWLEKENPGEIPEAWLKRFEEIAKAARDPEDYANAVSKALKNIGVSIDTGGVGQAILSVASTYLGLNSIEKICTYLKYGYNLAKKRYEQRNETDDLVTARQASNLGIIPAAQKVTVIRDYTKRSREDCYRGKIVSVGQGRQNNKGEWIPGEWEAGDRVFVRGEGLRIKYRGIYIWFYDDQDVMGCIA